MKDFIVRRIISFKYAFKGMYILLTSEHSIITQFFIFCPFIILGFYVGISPQEWLFQTIAFGLVFATEGINTAIEKLADFVHPQHHEKIGRVKDIAAGAVCFAALTALFVICIIYYPYIF